MAEQNITKIANDIKQDIYNDVISQIKVEPELKAIQTKLNAFLTNKIEDNEMALKRAEKAVIEIAEGAVSSVNKAGNPTHMANKITEILNNSSNKNKIEQLKLLLNSENANVKGYALEVFLKHFITQKDVETIIGIMTDNFLKDFFRSSVVGGQHFSLSGETVNNINASRTLSIGNIILSGSAHSQGKTDVRFDINVNAEPMVLALSAKSANKTGSIKVLDSSAIGMINALRKAKSANETAISRYIGYSKQYKNISYEAHQSIHAAMAIQAVAGRNFVRMANGTAEWDPYVDILVVYNKNDTVAPIQFISMRKIVEAVGAKSQPTKYLKIPGFPFATVTAATKKVYLKNLNTL